MTKQTFSALIIAGLAFMPMAALAQDVSVDTSAAAEVTADTHSVNAGGAVKLAAQAKVSADLIPKAKEHAAAEINRRVDSLTKMNDRVSAATHLSADAKTSITGTISQQITALQALNTKIQSEDSTTTLKDDIKSIADSYRIYALVMPQLAITAAADRVIDVADAMTQVGAKIDARLSASTTTPSSVTTALADMKAKITAAQTAANDAVSAIMALKPDNGDKAAMEANTKVLKDARTKIQTAHQDLVTARKDLKTMMQTLKINVATAASASATASSTTP